MGSYVALLRAVNVGGTGKLPMADLRAMCEAAGFQAVRTHIASGNVIFKSSLSERAAKEILEARLQAYAGKPVGVIIRTADAMAEIVAANPFLDAPPNRVIAVFLDDVSLPSILEDVTGRSPDETIKLGQREIYIRYGAGMAHSKLRIPAAKAGTARNMNTVAKLAVLAAR